jgi:hypothetical protein
MYRIATCKLKSAAAYSQSRQLTDPSLQRKPNETWEDYEERIWRHKAHADENGHVIIPPAAFKQAIDAAAKYLSIQIPGKGKATYTKHFKSGVIISDLLTLDTTVDELDSYAGQMNSDGVRGSGKRVYRRFPEVRHWEGTIPVGVFDDCITEDVFEKVLRGAGSFIGIGRFRPENGGYYGRFEAESIDWQEVA